MSQFIGVASGAPEGAVAPESAVAPEEKGTDLEIPRMLRVGSNKDGDASLTYNS